MRSAKTQVRLRGRVGRTSLIVGLAYAGLNEPWNSIFYKIEPGTALATGLLVRPAKKCVQRRLRSACAYAQSAQSVRCQSGDAMDPLLPRAWHAKTLIRLRGVTG